MTARDLDELDTLFDEVERLDAADPGWIARESDGAPPPLSPRSFAVAAPTKRRRFAPAIPIFAIIAALLATGVALIATQPEDELTPRGQAGEHAAVTLAVFAHRGDALIDLGAHPGEAIGPNDRLSVRVRSVDPDLVWALVWAEDDAGHHVAMAPGDGELAFRVPADGTWAGPDATFGVDTLGLSGTVHVVAVFVPLRAPRGRLDVFAAGTTARRAVTMKVAARAP